MGEQQDAAGRSDYGQIAVLRAIGGSAVGGKIRVIDRGSGASMLVSIYSLPYGPFRIALHETPNCTSPNGFSAGPPWAPASAGKPAEDLIPIQYASPDSSRLEIEVRLPGVRATGPSGVAGHSVVVYSGSHVTAAQPDASNERIACGVFEPATMASF
jgi:Cu/Zn superoxide dismutase